MSERAFEVITPKNTLRDKVNGRAAPVLDAAALARAEAALKSLSGQFQSWMEEEVVKLDAARVNAKAAGWTVDSLGEVHSRAHDAKGMGTTYEYPIVTRIAASLCRMLETEEHRRVAAIHANLLEAHIDAVKAAVRGGIKSEENPIGRALAEELEARAAVAMKDTPPG